MWSLWLDSDDVVTILSPTIAAQDVEGYKTMYLCRLDS